ncbi:sulfotransferase 1E1-like isoform X3 [Watersipora subatra]|uniref:sulfotransferase 1E1-like isoform X3 n=1 Tax=Watersipora subatra TaxID=2589382 RepID=UPI00355C304F
MEERLSCHPLAGSKTGEYFVSDDGKVKVPAIMFNPEMLKGIRADLASYKWKSSDFLLAAYAKNGTHFMWEVMTMLLNGSADNVTQPKEVVMIDLSPVEKSEEIIPSPRVLNTHYRIDVLPAEFRKGKTVVVVRNPKDACVSMYYHEKNLVSKLGPAFAAQANMSFDDFIQEYMYSKDMPHGSYFDYTEYMWSLRDEPNILLVFYEDLKLKPAEVIQKVNEFMGTNRSPELVQQIAEATDIKKMRKAKEEAKPSKAMMKLGKELQIQEIDTKGMKGLLTHMYRKGEIGDWKNHFTVAQNEAFDAVLAAWKGGKDIPFIY